MLKAASERQPGFEPRVGVIGNRRDQRGIPSCGFDGIKGLRCGNIYKPVELRLVGGTKANRKVNPMVTAQTPPRTKVEADERRTARGHLRAHKMLDIAAGNLEERALRQQLRAVVDGQQEYQKKTT